MRKLILMVGLVVVAFACSSAGDMLGEILDSGVPDAGAETPGDGTSMQYVGNSEKVFRGVDAHRESDGGQVHEGIYTYYAACQETFGPGHRMCTANEIIFTTKIPQLSEGFAWYDPRAKCGSSLRAAVSEIGTFGSQNCFVDPGSELPIACCGPK